MAKKIHINILLLIISSNILFILTNNISNDKDYIIFPLKTMKISDEDIKKEESSDHLGLIINTIIPNNLYLTIKIDSGNIEFPGYLTFTSEYNYFGINSCLKLKQIKEYSIRSPLEQISGINIFTNDYQKYYYLEENMTIYIFNNDNHNKKEEFKISNMNFILPEENEGKAECLIIGLNPMVKKKTDIEYESLPSKLKQNNINSNFKAYLTFLYNYSHKDNKIILNRVENEDENNGLLIIGKLPHMINPKLFNCQNYKEIDNYDEEKEKDYKNYFTKSIKENSWAIKIDNISFNSKNITRDITDESYIGQFSIDIIPFLLPMNLFRDFIDVYLIDFLSKGICIKKGRPLNKKFTHTLQEDKRQTFIFIYCKKSKIENISNFYESLPTLKIQNNLLNKSFEFSGKELFMEDDEYTYLMLIPDLFNNNRITLGRLFMEKYLFTFNFEKNKIGFYDEEFGEKQKDKIFKNNIVFQIFLYIFFFGALILLGYSLINKYLSKSKECKQNSNDSNKKEQELIDVRGFEN
jgi:hypothetical protein